MLDLTKWDYCGLGPRRDAVNVKETWRSDKGISHRSQYIILSLEVGKWAGDIAQAQLPDRLHADYVRVYQRQGQ